MVDICTLAKIAILYNVQRNLFTNLSGLFKNKPLIYKTSTYNKGCLLGSLHYSIYVIYLFNLQSYIYLHGSNPVR